MGREKTLELFRCVCEKPGMYVQRAGFTAVAAYIDGYDAALQGVVLIGFREWLLTGTDEWTNLPWWSLIRLRRYPSADLARALSDAEDESLIGELDDALKGFGEALAKGGLSRIYVEHNEWLLRQRGGAVMITLEVSIGPDGLTEPVAFARLVRSHLAIDLSEAKRILDELTERKSVTLRFHDHATRDAFCRDVAALGLLIREPTHA
jgi:hypothetical protein